MLELLMEFDELMDGAACKLTSPEFDEFCERILESFRSDYDITKK